jgi:hypothetical protein
VGHGRSSVAGSTTWKAGAAEQQQARLAGTTGSISAAGRRVRSGVRMAPMCSSPGSGRGRRRRSTGRIHLRSGPDRTRARSVPPLKKGPRSLTALTGCASGEYPDQVRTARPPAGRRSAATDPVRDVAAVPSPSPETARAVHSGLGVHARARPLPTRRRRPTAAPPGNRVHRRADDLTVSSGRSALPRGHGTEERHP